MIQLRRFIANLLVDPALRVLQTETTILPKKKFQVPWLVDDEKFGGKYEGFKNSYF